jgi:hypothetical protein
MSIVVFSPFIFFLSLFFIIVPDGGILWHLEMFLQSIKYSTLEVRICQENMEDFDVHCSHAITCEEQFS